MQVILLVLSAFVIIGTLLPFLRQPHWWIRMFDFPRVQLALLGGVTLGLSLYFHERSAWYVHGITGLLGLCLLFQFWRIWPYTRIHPFQSLPATVADGDRVFRLVVSNVLMDNRDGDEWLRVVRGARPDILVAVETDAWWAEQAQALTTDLPHAVSVPRDNTYGMVVYSRWPLRDVETRHLVEEDVPSVWGGFELPGGDEIRFAFIHPRPPRPDIQQDSVLRDAELVRVARELEGTSAPTVVAGDLNDVAWSRTTRLFQHISGLLDPRIGRGLYSTFHADYPVLRWPLDHVFHSEDLRVVRIDRLGNVGSDHFPMMIELAYEPKRSEEQDAPQADAGDREVAREMLAQEAEVKANETPEEKRKRQREDR